MKPLGTAAVRILKDTPSGVSMILGPDAEPLTGTLSGDEGLLHADIDLSRAVEPKQFHDVVGYYNRFDIFRVSVNNGRINPIEIEEPGTTRSYLYEEIEAQAGSENGDHQNMLA